MRSIGTDYGGWVFDDCDGLQESTIISVGCGEDISFDVGFASEYSSKVILVDPTPRSIVHVNSVLKRLGSPATSSYNGTGKQSIDSYDLTNLNESNFEFIEKALWVNNNKVKFYLPTNLEWVSHSIGNYQRGFVESEEYIKVDTITINDIMTEYNLDEIELLKIDIEGAEIEVIKKLIEDEIYPKQLLVEYDELGNEISNKMELTHKRFFETHSLLLNYYDVFFDDGINYSYKRKI
jgi:FkbM family methyltransferase